MNVQEAIVLVGGLGTRLRNVVADVPKPLAPVAGRPFLERILDRLEQGGIRRTILASGYLADVIEDRIRHRWGRMDVAYSVESSPLGTGGAIRAAASKLSAPGAHVMNGDTWLDYSFAEFENAVHAAGAPMGVALAYVDNVARYGRVDVDGGRIVAFREKGGSGPGTVNAGCYFLGEESLAALPDREAFSFESDVLVPVAATGNVVAYTATRGFIDIGVPEDYLRAQSLFRSG